MAICSIECFTMKEEDLGDDGFHGNRFLFSSDASDGTNNNNSLFSSQEDKVSPSGDACSTFKPQPLEVDIKKLQDPILVEDEGMIKDINERRNIVEKHMGSMAQCRGKLGDQLREAGALNSLLSLLHLLISNCIPDLNIDLDEAISKLVVASLGALRDLACGNASNRLSIGTFTATFTKNCSVDDNADIQSGIDIITFFIKRYHNVSWHNILSRRNSVQEENIGMCNDKLQPTERGKLELKMFTSAVGVIRNITHSTQMNCEILHGSGVTEFFIWRLRHGTKSCIESESESKMGENESKSCSRLPHPSEPWREASFRIASSLINMAEKCSDCAARCATDDELIYLLLESWGGISIYEKKTKKYPVLHLGLIAVLNGRLRLKRNHEDEEEQELEILIQSLFERESTRKKSAQAREVKRKAEKQKSNMS